MRDKERNWVINSSNPVQIQTNMRVIVKVTVIARDKVRVRDMVMVKGRVRERRVLIMIIETEVKNIKTKTERQRHRRVAHARPIGHTKYPSNQTTSKGRDTDNNKTPLLDKHILAHTSSHGFKNV